MKKSLIPGLLLLICIVNSTAQSVTSDYFEVYTKLAHGRPSSGFSFHKDSILARISNIPDTAETYATFVITVNAVNNIDSLEFTLTNSQGQTAYNSGSSLSSLQASASFKTNNNTLYYTVGPFPYLKRFSATARLRGTDGQLTSVKSFSKN